LKSKRVNPCLTNGTLTFQLVGMGRGEELTRGEGRSRNGGEIRKITEVGAKKAKNQEGDKERAKFFAKKMKPEDASEKVDDEKTM